MASETWVTVDGNEAAASVAYRLNEVIAIYPITPASTMGELADEWAREKRTTIYGGVPSVVEMQSEGGAAGAVHGALQGGALSTTFTASQGLLLMIPNMYKIAGELLPFVLHVAARAVATHALSIFGDHSDVMACRQTGFAMLCANDVQEAQDMACVAQAATLESRIPFLHFFDGFRTSHEVAKIRPLSDDDLRALVDESLVAAHRSRALSPEHPVLRGTAQNPDAFFQCREASNLFYDHCPGAVEAVLERFAARTGRRYRLFEYAGHPEAERVIVIMGSGAETAEEAVAWMNARGERVGVLKVRLYRPFAVDRFLAALPRTVRRIAVLDRTKEPGAPGEPLFLDVVAALRGSKIEVFGGRFGLASKEFTPAMAKAALDEIARPEPMHGFTVGIVDDVTHRSLAWDRDLDLEPDDVARAVFFGLGADGTVGANKSSIKIIGEETDLFAQGYFVYDSKKSGAMTVSHLRFGPRPIRAPYLVRSAGFVAATQLSFLERRDVLACARPGAVLLLNAPYEGAALWDALPREAQDEIVEKRLEVHAIDAAAVARELGMGGRVNTIMQTCFFALSGVLPRAEAIAAIKHATEKAYAKKGAAVVEKNFAAIDAAIARLRRVPIPDHATATRTRAPVVSKQAPDFVKRVTARLLEGEGDLLPVSAFPVDGTWPTGTSKWEKRRTGKEIPVWDESLCIQCNKCALVCPHAAIRATIYPEDALVGAPAGWRSLPFKTVHEPLMGMRYTIQVSPDDCTGCTLCEVLCPPKNRDGTGPRALSMKTAAPIREAETRLFDHFVSLPEVDRASLPRDLKHSQLLEPLFEFSGACAGCGETPYLKLLTQLFGDRLVIANATGCSSIFGGNLPTTPYAQNRAGRGPAWANSLFEDNAEFGLGLRLAVEERERDARALLEKLRPALDPALVEGLLGHETADEAGIAAQRKRVTTLRERLAKIGTADARALAEAADSLVPRSVWIVGGDGWAYDIGYGGLDHVLSMGRKVNVLVLDTEVYSNTGGQQSKATPRGAVARFAAGGKTQQKKDLALLAMAYGSVYVARVALGARDAQTMRALQEAESYPGTSLVIAYSPCIAHGYDLAHACDQQRLAVDTGYWPLLRYDPRRAEKNELPLVIDSKAPSVDLARFEENEGRFKAVQAQDPARYEAQLEEARHEAQARFALYERIAGKGKVAEK